METGHWPVFLIIALINLTCMAPRMICGGIFYQLWKCKLVQNYPDQKFAATAIVTVAGETPVALERCLRGLKKSLGRGTTAHSLIVIIDKWGDPRLTQSNLVLAAITHKYADVILCTDARSKRRNLRELMRTAREKNILYPLTVLVDSDTFVTDTNVIEKLLRPFSDESIGGVTTAQLIDNPQTWVQKVSFWLEHARMVSSMSAASLFGQVLCLPGRMYAVRTELIEHKMNELVRDSFHFLLRKTRRCKAGDDRFITMCVMQANKKTIMVPDAIVTTLAPKTFNETRLMWTRWGRSSQGYTLRSPWLLKPRFWFAAFIGWGDIVITFSTVYLIAIHWPYAILTGSRSDPWYEIIVYAILGMTLTFISRQFVHLYKFPRSWALLPAFMCMVTIGQFIRVWAFFTQHHIGTWGTRDVDVMGTKGAWELDVRCLNTIDLPQVTEGKSI